MCAENQKQSWAWILGLSLLASTLLFSIIFYQTRKTEYNLTVSGTAKVSVTSDAAKWAGDFSRTVSVKNLKNGYQQIARDLAAVKKFFKDNGVADEDLVISPVFMEERYQYDSNAPTEYNLRQTVELQLSDVNKVTELANNTSLLINQGVIFSPRPIEYYYLKLPETRVNLLGEAIKDARLRADKIGESSGRGISSVKTVNVGVTQVTSVNSTEIYDYGAYDTSKIEKDITLTVKVTFGLK
ncbi:MAG: SIMPL domain-containing protein [Patescibacteria group bacterium]